MAGTGNTPRSRQLGAELRDMRTAANLTTRQLGKIVGYTNVTVTRWETGERPPSVEMTATILGALGVTGDDRDRLLTLAREAADPNWVAPGIDKQLAALMDYERNAVRITEVNPMIIPGLLQTANYARAIMRQSGASTGEADHRVAVRLGRRDVLQRAHPVEFIAFIGEHAIQYPPCPRAAMAEQLRHLNCWGEKDNITIQVVPITTEWTPMHNGPFMLIEDDRTGPVVHLEHYRSTVTITDARDTRDFKDAAEKIRDIAMSPERSSGLIAEKADQLEMVE